MSQVLARRMANIQPFYVMDLLRRAKLLEQQGRDIIHMEIGEPDFPATPAVIAAGIEAIQNGHLQYTEAVGLLALREKIAEFYLQHHAVKVAPQRICITPGASGALLLALAATLNIRDELLLADPGYPCNRNFAQVLGIEPRLVPVTAAEEYQLSVDLIKQHWTPATKGVLLASPSNPTGTVIAPEALKSLIASVEQLEGFYYADEIYQGLDYDLPAITALNYSEQVFVINSFSKYFGMTGWRIGWLIVPEAFVSAIERLAQNLFIATSTPAQYAALAAFSPENIQLLEQRKKLLLERRDFLYQELLALGFDVAIKPEGAFYIYANCTKYSHNSFEFAYQLLEAEGVAVTPGLDFGRNAAEQHLRFAYTTSIERIAEALQRISRFIA